MRARLRSALAQPLSLLGFTLGIGVAAALSHQSATALLLGLGFSVVLQLLNASAPRAEWAGLAKKALPLSIILIGSTLNFRTVLETGVHGALSTLVTLSGVFLLGAALSRVWGTGPHLTLLLSAGTGICGGSAIAALGPVIGASTLEMGVALTVVFLLNALALVVFPWIGHAAAMTQTQFGTWAALAIHDTSSVVGASSAFGQEALATATLLKLTRALWILPLVLVASALLRRRSSTADSGARPPFPRFILGFLLTSALFSFVPALEPFRAGCTQLARSGLVAALFWIGASLDLKKVRSVGARSLGHALTLWVLTAGATFFWIAHS